MVAWTAVNLVLVDVTDSIIYNLLLFYYSVNVVDRESLNADDSAYGGSNVAIKARAIAFTGIAMGFGSIGGALAIFILKFLIPGRIGDALYLVSIISKAITFLQSSYRVYVSHFKTF